MRCEGVISQDPHTALRKACWARLRLCSPLLSMKRTSWKSCSAVLPYRTNLCHIRPNSAALPQVAPASSSFSLLFPSPTFSSLSPLQLPPGALSLHFTRWKRPVATTRHRALILSKQHIHHSRALIPATRPVAPQSLLTSTHASLAAYQSSLQ